MPHSLYSCSVTDTAPLLSERNLTGNNFAGFEIIRFFPENLFVTSLLSTEREAVCYRAINAVIP